MEGGDLEAVVVLQQTVVVLEQQPSRGPPVCWAGVDLETAVAQHTGLLGRRAGALLRPRAVELAPCFRHHLLDGEPLLLLPREARTRAAQLPIRLRLQEVERMVLLLQPGGLPHNPASAKLGLQMSQPSVRLRGVDQRGGEREGTGLRRDAVASEAVACLFLAVACFAWDWT